MARKRDVEHCTKLFTLAMRPAEHDRLREFARDKGVTTSALIRSRLEEFLEPAPMGRPWPEANRHQ